MADIKRKFLDYAGLQQFWGIIDAKFATKVDAAKVGSFAIAQTDDDANTRTITYTDSAVSPTTYNIVLPKADSKNGLAGLITAQQADLIDNIEDKINMAAPFHGLELNGDETYRDDKRHANIGLQFSPEGVGVDRKAYIDLVDLNYPEGTWSEITEGEYNPSLAHHAKLDDKYYSWSVEGKPGPRNNLEEPLLRKPISRIDVSELVKAGLLQSADVILHNGQMHLKLVFITVGSTADKSETQEVLINISDLVDIYTAGEGIDMTNPSQSADDQEASTVINAKLASLTLNPVTQKYDMGSVRLGFNENGEGHANKQHYKLTRDEEGNAYVAVPWEHTVVNVTSEGTSNGKEDGAKYLEVDTEINDGVDANGNPQKTFTFNIEVGAGIKNAEALAATSIQSVVVSKDAQGNLVKSNDYITTSEEQMTDGDLNIGKNSFVDLTQSAKDSLRLADTAAQNFTTSTVSRGDEHTPTGEDLVIETLALDGTEYLNEKGEKTIKITLGGKTTASLDKADTAMQTITIMGTQLDIDDPVYETAEAVKALSLGSAANVNTTEVVPEGKIGDLEGQLKDEDFKTEVEKPDGSKEARYTVATTKAVKTYVDNRIDALDQDSRDYVDSRINALDTVDTPGEGEKPHVVNAKTAAVYDYTTNKYAGEEGFGGQSEMILTQIGQTDGILDRAKTITHAIGIQDIHDFAPLSAADINSICGITA